jgi:diguanylate cyclase (GGDEF)-like protein
MADKNNSSALKFERRVVMPVLFVLALSFGLAIALLLSLAHDYDDEEVHRTQDLALSSVNQRQANIAKTIADYAFWGEAYRHLHAAFDLDWAFEKDNLGSTFFTSYGIDYVLLIGPDGQEVYGVDRGNLASGPLKPIILGGIDTVIQQALAASPSDGKVAQGFAIVGGELALMSAAIITPGSDSSVQLTEGAPSVVVLVDRLTPEELRQIGDLVYVKGLKSTLSPGASSPASRAVRTPDGSQIFLQWRLEHPGQRMVSTVLPGLMVSGLALTFLLLALLRRGFAATATVAKVNAELQAAHRRAAHQALHDATTGLANRIKLGTYLEERLTRREPVAVLFLDLDRFKPINDTLGHSAGDEVLRRVGARLERAAPDGLVARVGGDEFVMVIPTSGDRDLAAACSRLINAVSTPMNLEPVEATVGVSIGVSVFPSDADTYPDLLRYADIALYEAKREGRGTYRFFSSAMNEKLMDRRRLEADLRHALRHGQLVLHYQPRVDARSMAVRSVEALLRWQHPARGLLAPSSFIELAEESGLIIPIGSWVLREACRVAAEYDVAVSVNVSPVQFCSEDFIAAVQVALAANGLAAERLELELTEGILLENTERATTVLASLKALGVRLAMDDFGTGYSSLGYLRTFPFDTIKIDRQFVHDLGVSGDARAIVQAVVGLGRALGMSVTAEGVETPEQLLLLRADHCEEIQGFLTGRPCPEEELGHLVAGARPSIPIASTSRSGG